MLFALKNAEWEDEPMKLFSTALEKTIFHTTKCPKGLIFHICDFYIEEIAKVADGELTEDRTHALIEPFLTFYTKLGDHLILKHVEKAIFEQLLYQTELGQEYQETFDIWKKADFPTKSIDDIEINYQVRGNKSFTDDDLSDGEENDMDEEKALDPRAGRVNVNLTEIKFDALKLAETIENLRYKPFASSKSRKGLARMAKQLRKFANDVFPLGVQNIPYVTEEDDETVDVDLKAIQLAEFEKKLAIGGDVDSESSDLDEDLDNRKHGKLKRKNKEEKACKTKEKKQKLSKLHNERFFESTGEDFTKDQPAKEDEEDETIPKDTTADVKVKKKKKASSGDEAPRVKLQKRKPADAVKVTKVTKATSPSTESPTDPTFKITDEWSESLKEGEVEFFVPSRKTKLKALQQAEEIETQNDAPSVSSAKKIKIDDNKQQLVTPPRINLLPGISTNSGKRVKIALNKNQAQSAHEYIKQVKQSPNLPTNNLLKMPIKSVLKPGSLPSPINPFYQKKLSKNFNKSF
jgi:ribosomal RNA-processing protein 1